MVDLGPWTAPSKAPYKGHFGWIYGDSGLSTWLCLYKNGSYTGASRLCRQGFVVFYKTHKDGNPINSSEWDLRNGGDGYPSNHFVTDDWASTAAVGGHWTYDGVTVNPDAISLPADGKTHLGSFQFADNALAVNIFGSDLNGGNSAGGCKIAEVVLYDRVLTEQERLDTERYLMKKWNCGTHPADRVPSVGTMTFNDGTPAVIDTDAEMTIGTVAGSGTVVKKGAGTATVGMFAQDVSALALEGGTLAIGSGVTVADGAVLDVYIDENGIAGTATITGTLTIGGSATVRLHVPAGVVLGYGEYDIMAVSSVAPAGAHWTVDDTDGAHKGVVWVGYERLRNAIVLKIYPKALTVHIR